MEHVNCTEQERFVPGGGLMTEVVLPVVGSGARGVGGDRGSDRETENINKRGASYK